MEFNMVQKIDIMKENWDYLIILDACRYDYFEKYYINYFKGELKKIRSPASCTKDWLKKTFTGVYKDIIYVSSNPHINSKNSIKGFNAKLHFYKVIDVWEKAWDQNLGTVHPNKVNEYVFKTIRKYPSKRMIIHYMQPHYPYIMFGNITNRKTFGIFKKETLIDYFFRFLTMVFGNKTIWKLKECLGFAPDHPIESIVRQYGTSALVEAYVNNLKIVLESVAILIDKLVGTIVITSDHGELLGEYNDFSHPCGSDFEILLNVPYFKLNTRSI